MGCGNTKEKIENEMMEIKIARIELQMERYKDLQLLKDMDGKEIKRSTIPDYIDQEFLKEKIIKMNHLNQEEAPEVKNRSKRSKTVAIKKRTVKYDEGSSNLSRRKRRTTSKRKNSKRFKLKLRQS